MTKQEKEQLLQEALKSDPHLTDAAKEWAAKFKDRIRGTLFEHEMLTGNRKIDAKKNEK